MILERIKFFISLTLIKNEGIALLLILFLSTFLIKIYKHELKNNFINLIYLLFSFIPIISWKLFCYSKGIGNDYINSSILINLIPRLSDFENYKLIFYFLLLNGIIIIQ